MFGFVCTYLLLMLVPAVGHSGLWLLERFIP